MKKKVKHPTLVSYCLADKQVRVRQGKSPDAHVRITVVGARLKDKPANNHYLGEPVFGILTATERDAMKLSPQLSHTPDARATSRRKQTGDARPAAPLEGLASVPIAGSKAKSLLRLRGRRLCTCRTGCSRSNPPRLAACRFLSGRHRGSPCTRCTCSCLSSASTRSTC